MAHHERVWVNLNRVAFLTPRRAWTKNFKIAALERNEMFERAQTTNSMNHTDNPR